jgi:hypothetical protein
MVSPHLGQWFLVDNLSLPRHEASVILRIVALDVEGDTTRHGDMSECGIEMMPWSEWVRSFGLVEMGSVL